MECDAKQRGRLAAPLIAVAAVVLVPLLYFGAYFLAADYVDVGSNTPMYLMRYRVGSVSLDRFASFFEPARRVDDLCFRQRGATVVGWSPRR
jgi:hypothetical protein